MNQIEELLEMWRKDSDIDRTEPGKALLDIPKLHSKYLNILSRHRLLAKESDFKLNKMRILKWEYYTGKLDEEQLKQYGWEPFPYVLKTEVNNYIEADDDINKRMAIKVMHEEIVDVCSAILKELNSRTFQLRDFIAWERFIQGV
jgi:intein-encoded DNA endonuclease-like protein